MEKKANMLRALIRPLLLKITWYFLYPIEASQCFCIPLTANIITNLPGYSSQ